MTRDLEEYNERIKREGIRIYSKLIREDLKNGIVASNVYMHYKGSYSMQKWWVFYKREEMIFYRKLHNIRSDFK